MPKPFLTYDQLLDKLQDEKKLLIHDREVAKEILKNIGYFSLIGGYKTPFIDPMTRIYKSNTSFEDIYSLYQFDTSLRELVFKYLCEIECKIRHCFEKQNLNLKKDEVDLFLFMGQSNMANSKTPSLIPKIIITQKRIPLISNI